MFRFLVVVVRETNLILATKPSRVEETRATTSLRQACSKKRREMNDKVKATKQNAEKNLSVGVPRGISAVRDRTPHPPASRHCTESIGRTASKQQTGNANATAQTCDI